MALFSRGKKSNDNEVEAPEVADDVIEQADATDQGAPEADAAIVDAAIADASAPAVGISVGTFRGLGAPSGDINPTITPAFAPPKPAEPEQIRLPRVSSMPPEQTHTVQGQRDNVLLRETLAQINGAAESPELLGVLRNMMQGHLFVRVPADSVEAIEQGKPIPVGVAKNEAGEDFLLAFSSAKALLDSIKTLPDNTNAGGLPQPSSVVLRQVVDGEYAGIVIDNDSAPHRAVFPKSVIERVLSEGDPKFQIKTLLTMPRSPEIAVQVAMTLAQVPTWVAVGEVDGSSGIAEAHLSNGKTYVQVFSHPIEVAAMERSEKPGALTPGKLRKVLEVADHTDGVVIDTAGPSMVIPRALLLSAFDKAGVVAE